MAGGQERVLRRRIKSVQSTKKITKAMELIAASPDRQGPAAGGGRPALQRPDPTRSSATSQLAAPASVNPLAPGPGRRGRQHRRVRGGRRRPGPVRWLQRQRDPRRRGGRCAGTRRRAGPSCSSPSGKKVQSYFRFRKWDIAAAINGVIDRPTYEDARARRRRGRCPASTAGEIDRVAADLHAVPVGRYPAGDRTPLLAARSRGHGPHGGRAGAGQRPDAPTTSTSRIPTEILDALLPRYVEARLFGALLEASASFFAAQQRAMASASDNADELITKLDQAAQPGPPGQHHDRDHGDRRAGPKPCPRASREAPHDHHRPSPTSPALKDGRIVSIAGPVVDVEFPPDAIPEINFAVQFDIELEGHKVTVTGEVAQQIGDSRVRVICLKPTDGLKRGTPVTQPRSRAADAGRRRDPRPRVQRHRRAARHRPPSARSRPAGRSTGRRRTSTPWSRAPRCSRRASRSSTCSRRTRPVARSACSAGPGWARRSSSPR